MAVVGYYDITLQGANAAEVNEITDGGHTAVAINTPDAASLAGLDVLYVWVPSNTAYGAEYLANKAAIEAAVANGMNIIIFDRAVGNADIGTILPGQTTLPSVRAESANVDFTAAGIARGGSGPGGTIDNTSLDGGNWTVHGHVEAANLPAGSTILATNGANPTQAVGFEYSYGLGTVMYYGMPLDYYSNTDPEWQGFVTNLLSTANVAICFAPGTLIKTLDGPVAIEDLKIGQMIWTLDNGYQPLRHLFKQSLANGEDTGVSIPAGLLGNTTDLTVTCAHLILISSHIAELYFGEPEVLVPASALLAFPEVGFAPADMTDIYNLGFNEVQIISANDVFSESLVWSTAVHGASSAADRRHALSYLGGRIKQQSSCRRVLRGYEARVLVAALFDDDFADKASTRRVGFAA